MAAATMAGTTATMLVVLAGLVNIGSGAPIDVSNSDFCANETFVGNSINCTEEEKTCLIANMLYRDLGTVQGCYPFGFTKRGNDKDACLYVASKDEYRDHNHLVADCLFPNECEDTEILMAYNGRCMEEDICKGLSSSLYLFGGNVCNCPGDMKDKKNKTIVLQPMENERCAIPDFSVDLHTDRIKRTFPAKVRCPTSRENCTENEVWYNGHCQPLFEESIGVCVSGFELMLEARGFGNDRTVPQQYPTAKVKCFRKDMGCDQGRIRLAIDPDRCHNRSLFPKEVKLHRDAFGYYHLQYNKETRRHNFEALFECVKPRGNRSNPKRGNENYQRKSVSGQRRKKLRHHSNIRRS